MQQSDNSGGLDEIDVANNYILPNQQVVKNICEIYCVCKIALYIYIYIMITFVSKNIDLFITSISGIPEIEVINRLIFSKKMLLYK